MYCSVYAIYNELHEDQGSIREVVAILATFLFVISLVVWFHFCYCATPVLFNNQYSMNPRFLNMHATA